MTDIKVPIDDLQDTVDALGRVLELLDQSGEPPDLDTMLGGAGDVVGAADAFESRWKDGRAQMTEEGTELLAKVREVVDGFKKTDQELADSLTDTSES